MRLLHGSDRRVLVHHRLVGIVFGRHQQVPVSCGRGGFGHHHLPYTLYDTPCHAKLPGHGEASAQQVDHSTQPSGDQPPIHHTTEQMEGAPQTDDSQHRGLLHPECGCHSLDVHVRTSLNAQPAARLATPLVRQCHHGRAHRHLHSTLPACHRDEEKPQQRVETTVGGEQHQPHTAPLHHRGEVSDSPGLYLLYLQLPEPVYRCADDQHRYCGGIAHHRFQKNEETKHQDGASVHPQPSLTRYRGTGEGHQTASLRGTPARPRHPHQRV